MGLFSSIGHAIGSVVGGITGASEAADAASRAAATQAGASEAGIAENRRQFDITQRNLAPFLSQGQSAIGMMGALQGLNGADAQAQAIAGIQGGPQYSALAQQGEDAILANASATGGLRGGNTQGALAQFRPQLLNQLINERLAGLGGIAGLGSGVGTSLGSLGAGNAQSIAQLLQQRGAATAGGQLAQGGATRQAFGDLLNIGGTLGRIAVGGGMF